MTDYLNPHRIYPDCPSRRIDNPPGFDSIRGNSDQEELSAYRATGLTPEAVQEMVSFPYTADDDEEVTKMQANQCVSCGADMPEGDQVCRGCVGIKPTGEIRFTEDRLLFYWKDAKFEIPSVYWLAEAVREKMERELRHE